MTTSRDTNFISGADLDPYTGTRSYPTNQKFSYSWSPVATCKEVGVPTWIPTSRLSSSTTANYDLPATMFLYFAAPLPAHTTLVQMGDLVFEYDFVFKGRNA